MSDEQRFTKVCNIGKQVEKLLVDNEVDIRWAINRAEERLKSGELGQYEPFYKHMTQMLKILAATAAQMREQNDRFYT
jgi:hypothetical protein